MKNVKNMLELGQADPPCFGDFALLTTDNLDLLADEDKEGYLMTRLKEYREVIAWAAKQAAEQDMGII